MTFDELKTEVFALLGDDKNDPKHFAVAEVGRYINDTIRRMAYESGSLEVRHFIDIQSGTGVYDLPAKVTRIFRVAYDGERIGAASTHELDRYDRGWPQRSGLVQVYYLDRLEHDQIGIWRIPEADGTLVVFDQELGTLVEIEDLTVNMRFESKTASLGVVTDFTQDSDTVVFVAGTGGGADEDYGIVVDVSSTESGATYTFSGEFGIVVDWEDSAADNYDAEIFQSTTENTATTEYGIVTDINTDDGSDVFFFDSEFGIVIDYNSTDNNLDIWAKEDPEDLADDTDIPRLPVHAHMGIAFGAAGQALMKNSEMRNPELAQIMIALESEYTGFLRKLVVKRAAESRRQMRQQIPNHRLNRVHPRLPGEYPRMLH
jgi:hypothetical protein